MTNTDSQTLPPDNTGTLLDLALQALQGALQSGPVQDLPAELNDNAAFQELMQEIDGRRQEIAKLEGLLAQYELSQERLMRSTRYLAALGLMGQSVVTSLNPAEVQNKVVHTVLSLLDGAEGVSLLLVDGGELEFSAVSGENADRLRGQRIPADVGVAGLVLKSGRSMSISGEEEQGTIYRDIEKVSGRHIRSLLTVPLEMDNHVIGVIQAVHSRANAFGEDELQLLESSARWVTIAIENARLYHDAHNAQQLAEALTQAATAFNSSLELDEVLDRIIEQLVRVVPCHAANVMLVDGTRARVIRHRGYEDAPAVEQQIEHFQLSLTSPSLQQMCDTREPILVTDISLYPGWKPSGTSWLRSYAGAPMLANGQVIGFLNLDSELPSFFGVDTLPRLTALAEQAAPALANARLHKQLKTALQQEQAIRAQLAQAAKAPPRGQGESGDRTSK
ncbi:MAG: GAF domain-containing protein, partial [Anaerolineae bacterium]